MFPRHWVSNDFSCPRYTSNSRWISIIFYTIPDIDECKTSSHGCDISVSVCINDDPGFHCKCHEGYKMNKGVCSGKNIRTESRCLVFWGAFQLMVLIIQVFLTYHMFTFIDMSVKLRIYTFEYLNK